MRELTEHERTVAINALWFAAEKYQDFATACREGSLALTDQFQRQADDARALADAFENEEV